MASGFAKKANFLRLHKESEPLTLIIVVPRIPRLWFEQWRHGVYAQDGQKASFCIAPKMPPWEDGGVQVLHKHEGVVKNDLQRKEKNDTYDISWIF